MKIFEISDDSGFMGIANFDKYQSFLSPNWDFEMIKERIINEMNFHHLLLWGTGSENYWKVKFDTKFSNKPFFREDKGVIEITNEKLYLTNYESLTMGAQFENIRLPEKHHEKLYVELENGKYMVKFRQMENPEKYEVETEDFDFEIALTKIVNMPEIYVNNFNKIFWSNY